MFPGWMLTIATAAVLTLLAIVPTAVVETTAEGQAAAGVGIVAAGIVYTMVIYLVVLRPLERLAALVQNSEPVPESTCGVKEIVRLRAAMAVIVARSEALRLRLYLANPRRNMNGELVTQSKAMSTPAGTRVPNPIPTDAALDDPTVILHDGDDVDDGDVDGYDDYGSRQTSWEAQMMQNMQTPAVGTGSFAALVTPGGIMNADGGASAGPSPPDPSSGVTPADPMSAEASPPASPAPEPTRLPIGDGSTTRRPAAAAAGGGGGGGADDLGSTSTRLPSAAAPGHGPHGTHVSSSPGGTATNRTSGGAPTALSVAAMTSVMDSNGGSAPPGPASNRTATPGARVSESPPGQQEQQRTSPGTGSAPPPAQHPSRRPSLDPAGAAAVDATYEQHQQQQERGGASTTRPLPARQQPAGASSSFQRVDTDAGFYSCEPTPAERFS